MARARHGGTTGMAREGCGCHWQRRKEGAADMWVQGQKRLFALSLDGKLNGMDGKAIERTGQNFWIERIYNYTISYAKAWRAKQKVFEMRFGTYKDSYDNLPHVKQFPNAEEGRSIVQRVFFCFGPCVRVFQYCRPILCIDGTFLTGQYNGTILTAIGIDGNNQVLPVAFAFVEGENTDSWYWFLERVKNQVVSSRSDVCLISDRHSGILHAIDKLKYGNGASPPLWPDVHSRWCMRHLAANFHDHFKNKELTDMFKRLCYQNQQQKFNALWKLLDELTAKQATESSSSASIRTSKPFSQWIQDKPKEKWALLYDTNGKHYRIMTTNIAESYNMVMRGSRGLPLVGSRGLKLHARIQVVVVCARERTVRECLIGNNGIIHCSCFKPQLLHLPCSHVLAACREVSVDPTTFVSAYYKKETIAATWKQELYGYGM
ncbi:hypothetical protein U9M48_041317, partial [Paspalum notatum var. saurae]